MLVFFPHNAVQKKKKKSRSVPDPSLSRRLLPRARLAGGWMAREAAKLCVSQAFTPLVRVALHVSFLRLRDEGEGSSDAALALLGRNFQQVWCSS